MAVKECDFKTKSYLSISTLKHLYSAYLKAHRLSATSTNYNPLQVGTTTSDSDDGISENVVSVDGVSEATTAIADGDSVADSVMPASDDGISESSTSIDGDSVMPNDSAIDGKSEITASLDGMPGSTTSIDGDSEMSDDSAIDGKGEISASADGMSESTTSIDGEPVISNDSVIDSANVGSMDSKPIRQSCQQFLALWSRQSQ
jgi:hypothetical protein